MTFRVYRVRQALLERLIQSSGDCELTLKCNGCHIQVTRLETADNLEEDTYRMSALHRFVSWAHRGFNDYYLTGLTLNDCARVLARF